MASNVLNPYGRAPSRACISRRLPNRSVPAWEWRRTKRETLEAELAGKFIANSRSHVYHTPGCRNAATISAGNRVAFESAEAAERAGYRPGNDCHPRKVEGR